MGEASEGSSPVAGRLTRDADELWRVFLGEQASLILQVVHLFERDPDQVQDCFLFVCERLRRGDLRRIRRFRAAGSASFATWLRAVVRRLCIDCGATATDATASRAIARLPDLDQEVFRCVHQRGLSENESFHSIKALWPGLTRDQFADALARVRIA